MTNFVVGLWTKTSVNYEYHSPDPTETAQRLALINYFNAGEEKNGAF
uniref:Uncharacterized protein n=1 Tax=Klebsiella pneumoniae TaxID=573 RepID=A0A8B0SS66_KLEPN|nr:hypothetical protein [Klebsiella pneumoniae]